MHSVTWRNVVHCVSNELFPQLSIKLDECVQERLLKDTAFKLSNVGDEAVEDIMGRLMKKRTMNNVEIGYLNGLIQRAVAYRRTKEQLKLQC